MYHFYTIKSAAKNEYSSTSLLCDRINNYEHLCLRNKVE